MIQNSFIPMRLQLFKCARWGLIAIATNVSLLCAFCRSSETLGKTHYCLAWKRAFRHPWWFSQNSRSERKII